MNIQVSNTEVTVSNKYVYHSDGSPNLGMLVILFRISGTTLTEVGRDITNTKGVFTITTPLSLMMTGDYEIRTYGSSTVQKYVPDGDWEKFHFDNPNDISGEAVPDLILVNLPTFAVTETSDEYNEISVDTNSVETTTAIFTISNINIQEGRIGAILIEYRKTGFTEEYYTQLKAFVVDSTSDTTSLTFKAPLTLYVKPTSYYDFRCYIQGVNGEWAVYNSTKVTLSDTNVAFDGITDLPEYIEVENLEVTNANNSETGILPGEYADLTWTDPRSIGVGFYPKSLVNGATGSNYIVSYNQAQRIAGFGVFMYVTEDSTPPTNEYPVSGLSDTGMWYYMGEYEKATAKIRCPFGTNVAFWVGMRSQNTNSSILKNFLKI